MSNSPPVRARPNWDDTWLTVARVVAERSLCDRDRVGAVIVSATNRIVATGYNGPPGDFQHGNLSCRHWCKRSQVDNGFRAPEVVRELIAADYSDCPSLHAEANALSVCDRSVREGGTIYVTSDVCYGCAKLIANSGLVTVCAIDTGTRRHSNDAYSFLEDCGVTVYLEQGKT